MKKYLYLFVFLLAGSMLHAAEPLEFTTVLSAPVGSFGELKTTSCSYPNIKGSAESALDFAKQVVVNFGPTGKKGKIYLEGGPLNIDSLLLEDGTVFNGGSTVWMVDNTGKVELYPGADLQVARAFITTLQIPTTKSDGNPLSENSSLVVEEILQLQWQNLRVNTLGIPRLNTTDSFTDGQLGDLSVQTNETGHFVDDAGFQDIPESSVPGKFLVQPK